MPYSRIRSLFSFIALSGVLLAPGHKIHAAELAAVSVQSIDGTAKIQRIGNSGWDKLSIGSRVGDNDLIETSLSSRVTLKLPNATATIGSSSRAMISVPEKKLTIGFSLLNGGVLITATGPGHYSVFTGSGVAELDHGTLAVNQEPVGNQTELFALADTAVIRGIMQQKGKQLAQGKVSFIRPGAPPLPAVPLTVRQTTVLNQFFGDSCIARLLKSAAIIPVDDRGIDNTISSVGIDSVERKPAELQTYKRPFSTAKIYGAIVDDIIYRSAPYTVITAPPNPTGRNLSVGLLGDIGFCDGSTSPLIAFVPRWTNGIVDVALRLQLARNSESNWIFNYNKLTKTFRNPGSSTDSLQTATATTIYNPVDHITIGSTADSLYVSAGTITDLTLGHGLIVNHFRNVDFSRAFQPLGVSGQANFGELAAKGFLADASDPALGGVYLSVNPSSYYLGAGVYFDAKQNAQNRDSSDLQARIRDAADLRFATPPNRIPDSNEYNESALMYEFGFGACFMKNNDFSLKMNVDYAQLVLNGKNDGFVLRAPEICVDWRRSSLKIGMDYTTGRAVSQEFDQFYFSRRSYFDLFNSVSYLYTRPDSVTDTNILSRSQTSLFVNYRVNPIAGVSLEIGGSRSISSTAAEPYYGTSMPGDYSYSFALSADSTLIPLLSYATIFANQSHAVLFSHLNSEAGFSFMTKPIVGVALQAGGRYFQIPTLPSSSLNLERKDVFELSLCAIWGVL